MRIALLSIRDPAAPSDEVPAPLRDFGGIRLIDRQLDLVLAAGCTVIACVADELDAETVLLQHRVEAAGARFVLARSPQNLVGLANSGDALIALAPGVLAEEGVVAALCTQPAIMTLPAEVGISLGGERIDAIDAWAGLMAVPPVLLEQLAGLPADSEPMSVLLRLALQAGVRRTRLDPALIDRSEWLIGPDQMTLDTEAARWARARAGLTPFSAPGLASAERAGVRLSRDLLARGGARIPAMAGLAAGAGSLAATLAEWPAIAVCLAFAMALLSAIANPIERISKRPADPQGSRRSLTALLRRLIDPVLAVSLAAAAPEGDGWLRLFVPAVMVIALTLASRSGPERLRPTFSDRVLLGALFVPAALLSFSQVLAAVIALAVFGILLRGEAKGLTRA